MSYAIIRNQKHTKDNMIKLSPHNERVKQKYSNKNIDTKKSYMNYHLKKPIENNYFKEFKRLKEANNLKGQLHKNSIYACEMIITSDNEFFKKIGLYETKRYFKTAYEFVCNYNNLGEENIISAVVHLDEETPHMHLTFIPVVDSKDKDGNPIRKIGGNDFWKEKNSYMKLQDKFYEYIKLNNFDLERGKQNSNRCYKTVDELKEITNFYKVKEFSKELRNKEIVQYVSMKSFLNYEEFTPKNVDEKLLQPLLQENTKLFDKIKTLKLEITKVENILESYEELQLENENLKESLENKEHELNVMYKLIARLNEEKERLVQIVNKYGINIEQN